MLFAKKYNKKLSIFIWILYQSKDEFYINEALEVIKVSNMTLTRAYRQLCATKLFKEHKNGRKIYLTTHLNKLNLFNQMKSYLQSPIKKQGFILNSDIDDYMILSGESALSQYSFINPPKMKIYAVDKVNSNHIVIQNEYYSQEEQVVLQIWKYNPLLFSHDQKNIDKISLIISLSDNIDERLDREIKQLSENIFNKMESD